MALQLGNITFNSSDPLPLAKWWAEQLGGEIIAENDGWFVIVKMPRGPRFAFQKVDLPTPGENKIHLDFGSDNAAADIEQLVTNGATHVADHSMEDFSWTVLADPQGNQFCVASVV